MKDKKILLYAGTTEGRKLASYLGRRGVRLHVCVATAYGESLLPEEKNITVTHDRMDSGQMGEFMRVFEPDYVIDATHPYAKEVTKNLKSACEVMQVPYLRLVRGSEETKESICVENMDEAIKYLEKTEGNILVTTGSKELESYTRLTDYESRVYARVLSIGQVAVNCEELGFSGRHLICMQGPFSTEMNRAMLKEYDIAYMVTKESGLAGGYPQKCQAALEAGVKMVVIGRPEEEEGMNFEEMSKFLQKELELDNHWKVTLVGIGAGARDQVTLEAKRCCQEAELLIGAGRMIEAVAEVGQTIYEAYRPDEIISYIRENPEYENVTIALSGDTGFYSGAKKILELTKDDPQIETKVVPGVSSIIYFASKLGVTWEDAALVSLHGRKENLMAVIKENKKVFALVSNAEEIRQILTKMTEYGMGEVTVRIGTELSYKNEEIQTGTARSLLHYKGENLAVLYIENESGGESPVIPAIPDDTFVRGDVPMTKEEVRSISIAKLKIKKDAVVYDVGAGTGSISVEAAMVATQGNVYAIEQKVEAQELIRENARRMHVDNLHVIEGMAPEALEELPAPDCVFIGGSKGKLYEILDAIRKKNPFVRVVLNAISLETMMQVLKYTEENEIEEAEVIQVAVSRAKKVGSYHMMNGQNPIYVISFTSRPAKKEADPENEDDFVLEEINLDEVEPEDMTGDIVEDITKVISVGDLTPEKIREEMEESE
ncbi:precorrin-6A reductase [Dorea sp.]|uniref:precorrin-6A reductase n=1 Tax=Dorea sp. TaxID=2040332 RepID=UPI00399C3F71